MNVPPPPHPEMNVNRWFLVKKSNGNIAIRAIHGNCLFDTVLRVPKISTEKSTWAANTRYLAVHNRLERGLYHWNDYRSPMFNRTFGKLIWSERPYFPIKQTRYDISSVALSLYIILVQNLRMVTGKHRIWTE